MDAHVQECTEVCGVIYLQRGVLIQGAAAGVGMRKPLSGDSGFFTIFNQVFWYWLFREFYFYRFLFVRYIVHFVLQIDKLTWTFIFSY